MHNVKNNNGFSLVEAIVVAVIVGILAAVGIPQYIGYVNNQRQETVNNLAETAAASANAHYRRTNTALDNGVIAKNDTPLFLYFDSGKYEIKVSGDNMVVTELNKTDAKTKSVSYK